METDDFRVKKEDDQRQMGQRLVIKHDGEIIEDLQSMKTFPTPSVGDRLMLSSRGIVTDEQRGIVFEEDATTDPPDESEVYLVEGVGYEYASVEPSEELSDRYDSGFSVVVSLLVSKTTSTLQRDDEHTP
jgi:hypothetical protein